MCSSKQWESILCPRSEISRLRCCFARTDTVFLSSCPDGRVPREHGLPDCRANVHQFDNAITAGSDQLRLGARERNRRITSGNGPVGRSRLVHYEQTAVQAGLDSFAQNNPEGYASAIGEINGLLNGGLLERTASSQFASDRSYMRVLDGVREDLGRDIDFANQSDREAIGNALVRDARRSGACDQTGTRIKSC